MERTGSGGRASIRERISLAGVLVDRVGSARLAGFMEDGRSHEVVTVNVNFLRAARRDEAFRELINTDDLSVADGMPVAWLSRLRAVAAVRDGRVTDTETY